MTGIAHLPPAALAVLALTVLPAAAQDATGLADAAAQAPAREYMVAAANPLAVEAGAEILAEGGSAADAMIAVQLVLNLVEPQSSGIGGGAFLLYYDAGDGRLYALDGRETAPAAAGPDLFLDETGAPMEFYDAVVGGRSVGVPGTLRLMEAAHDRFGRLPWARLFEPAIRLAEDGFPVPPRLAGLLTGATAERLQTYPGPRAFFFPGGRPLQVGQTLTNPAFAATLRLIAEGGVQPFYDGPIARDIVQAVRGAAGNPGTLAPDDLAGYRVAWREPVCLPYRGYEVCGMGPPSSGGLAVAEMLGLLAHFDLPGMGPADPMAWHLFAEAAKLAYADRNAYVADPDFVAVPVSGLLDAAYLTARAQLIDPAAAMATPARAGNPPWDAGDEGGRYAPGVDVERPGTSHLAIVDPAGDMVSMTTTIEGEFGSQLMVGGFLLNNELTDFSFAPAENGRPVANRVEPGKRPRSSMAPTLVFDGGGDPVLAVGSPGGSRIPLFVAEVLVAVLDWDMDLQAAIDLPHVVNRNGDTELEAGTAAIGFEAPLTARGQTVQVVGINSGLHGIRVGRFGYEGGADPRRDGVALGR